MMKAYQLEDEFKRPELERKVLEYFSVNRQEMNKLGLYGGATLFCCEIEGIARLLSGESAYDALTGPETASQTEIEAALLELRRMSGLRELARTEEETAAALFAEGADPGEIAALLEQKAGKIRRILERGVRSRGRNGAELGQSAVAEALGRSQQRQRTGKAVQGVPTGIKRLDEMLNGLSTGLHLVAAGPGVGKTTLCLQWALEAARNGHPVVYVSYENSVENLMLKLLGARSQQAATQIERGYGDVPALERVLQDLGGALEKMQFVEGGKGLTIGAIAQEAELLKEKCQPGPGLVVIDYLQRAAHGLGYEQLRQNVSQMGGDMRELAWRLDWPVIAISSQNRAVGEYGRGGRPALDSLKESGDLEYGADTVMILHARETAGASETVRGVSLSVVKNRFGAVGQVELVFRADIGTFREEA